MRHTKMKIGDKKFNENFVQFFYLKVNKTNEIEMDLSGDFPLLPSLSSGLWPRNSWVLFFFTGVSNFLYSIPFPQKSWFTRRSF